MEISESTVWKFHDFSITHILREINFWDATSAKSDILTHLEALNLDFYDFVAFFVIFTKSTKFRSSKCAKKADLALLESSKLISRKI